MKKEREVEARKLVESYKILAKTLAQTYEVPPPTVRFSWKLYSDFGPGATYFFKEHKILVTYDTKPYEFAHEFKHYLQDIVEGRDYEEEWQDIVWKAWIQDEKLLRRYNISDYHPLEKDASKFGATYSKLVEEAGRKIYGSNVWTTKLLREKFRKGEVPDFVLTVFKEKIE